MRTSDELDPDLVALVYRAADEVPGSRADLAVVVRRRAARRYRMVVAGLASGAAAAVVAAVVVVGVALVGPAVGPAPARILASPPPAQRLFITPMGVIWKGTDGQDVGVKGNDELGEVLPSGRLVLRKVAGLSAVVQAVPLPDGGLAALGLPAATASAGAPSAAATGATDGPRPFALAVLRADGSPRWLGGTAGRGLLGADEHQVYLYDGGQHVLAVDLATGGQQLMPWLGPGVPDAVSDGRAIFLAGDRSGPEPTTCTVRTLDAANGAHLSDRSVPAGDCSYYGTGLSPDGRLLAIVQPGPHAAQSNQMVVVVVEVATGTQLARQVVDQSASDQLLFGGLSWSDPGHVRVAWIHVPETAVRMYDKAEVLRQATVPVPER